MDAFDADVVICAAVAGHPLGRRVRALFPVEPEAMAGVGSVLLLPEVLAKPMRDGSAAEVAALAGLLGRLDLRSVDPVTSEVATTLASEYRLRAADAVHLATAVVVGADRFVTNNRREFPASISAIEVTYPEDLDEP
ncbi:MAG TPA: PIN domain-containing protein [Pseudonocardia sp.]|nr:PIN domain-containing protein [Pseudonocardia sp.]